MSVQQRLREATGKASLRNVVSLIVLLILISGAVIGVSAWSRANGGALRLPFLKSAAPSGSQTQAVSLTLGPNKFAPASVTRAAGPFRLEVTNQSGAQAFTLQLKRDNGGGGVHEWRVQSGAGQTWSETVELAQGGYTLSVAENPACLFHITVQ
jgi:hypothetical protein